MSESIAQAFSLSFGESLFPESLLARYTPVEMLCEGETRQTFLLVENDSGRPVIAKRCDAVSAATECAMLARLRHDGLPALVERIDVGEEAFVIRSYAPGEPLHRIAAPLSEREAADIAARVLEILAYLHAQSPPVVHRDIKPSNIIVDRTRGTVTLIDFGISRNYQPSAEKDTVCMGTRAYAPPEQYGFMQTDPSADVYALGRVLTWMLTGDCAAIERIRSRPFRCVAERMTAFDPSRRYRDASRALRALRRRGRGGARLAVLAATAIICAASLSLAGFWVGRCTDWSMPALSALLDMGDVSFGDDVLEARVRAQLGVPTGPISAAQARSVQVLDLSSPTPETPADQRIRDVEALSGFTNLRELNLDWNNIEDLSPLRGLTRLRVLRLNGSGGIADFSPLAEMTDMRTLTLVGCQVFSDTLPLFSGMSNLTELWIENPRLTDLNEIARFPRLQILALKNCGIRDISPIAALPDLRRIDLQKIPCDDLTPLLTQNHLSYAWFSEDQRALVERQLSGARFEITYFPD